MNNSLWAPGEAKPDSYVLFRGMFSVPQTACVEICTVGSSWFQGWLDGKPFLEGPLRFALDHPEYQVDVATLPAGEHTLAFHCHHIGLETRILKDTPPFLWCEIRLDGEVLPISWRCRSLDSQASATHRTNPQLGWIEWRDTRREPEGWEAKNYEEDHAQWVSPSVDASPLPEPQRADLSPVVTVKHPLKTMAEGDLATTFGYAADDPAWVFHSRDRQCDDLPVKGTWRRYDLGRVRLGRPSLTLDLPAGAIVEIATSEALTEGRVSPYINLSGGPSCNLDRYIARGGTQTFAPLTPKGGRFVEVHVVNVRDARFVREEYLERTYHLPTEANFTCGDALLERIWAVGVETYRSCAEDAIIDNPTRERGQWVGDVASVGLEIAALAYHDLRLCKRALIQSAYCPREDGLVAGMSPGGCVYLPTYAFQWAVAVMNYYRHTGDRALLTELWPAARRNMAAIGAFLKEDGLHNVAGWNFVDWGYQVEEGPIDTACNLHYLWCVRAMSQWAAVLAEPDADAEIERRLTALLQIRIGRALDVGGWEKLGYHCAALALRLGLIEDGRGCLAYLKAHLLDCFPNRPDAPRNDNPEAHCKQLITPYFGHYVMPLFMERGETDFVLDQYRTCWGWMLEGGRTTWIELFDTRWSHSHQWSGCPSWQMSRYLLGLHPRMDVGPGVFDFRLEPGSLPEAAGRIPHPLGGWIEVSWKRTAEGSIRYGLTTDIPLLLRMPSGETHEVARSYSATL